MFNQHSLSAMTGIPAAPKKIGTHRGKRSRGKGPKNFPALAQTHAKSVASAMAAGDHQGAKQSALRLANALHAFTKNSMPPVPSANSAVANPMGSL